VVDVAAITAAVRDGYVPAHVYNDAGVFALEAERLFARSWTFVAHESEIPNNGDFVKRRVLADSFLVTRDEIGAVRVLLNMCVHRGMQVCRAEAGTTSLFRCPYHGWTYRSDGRLVGLPFRAEAYGVDDGFAHGDEGLLPAPSVAIHNGLVFVSLDPAAPPFEDWLGDFAYYLDFYTRQSPAGVEVRGPQRWRVRANWKIGAENFTGDSYHTPHTHASVVDIGLFGEPKAHKRKEGVLYHVGPGGGTTYKLPPGLGLAGGLRYVGYPDEMIERMAATWTPGQQALIGESGFIFSAATLFPNLSFVHNWPRIDAAGTVAPFISLRVWQPVGPDETEVLSWFAVARDAPEDFKARSYRAYLLCFGSSGMFEQDDVENWVSITAAAGGRMARRLLLDSRMGLDGQGRPIKATHAGFAGPGTAYQGFGEHNQRHWLRQWCDAIERDPPEVAPSARGGAWPGR